MMEGDKLKVSASAIDDSRDRERSWRCNNIFFFGGGRGLQDLRETRGPLSDGVK